MKPASNGGSERPPPGIPDDASWRSLSIGDQHHCQGCALVHGWDGVSNDPGWIERTRRPWTGYVPCHETWLPQWGYWPLSSDDQVRAGFDWPPPPGGWPKTISERDAAREADRLAAEERVEAARIAAEAHQAKAKLAADAHAAKEWAEQERVTAREARRELRMNDPERLPDEVFGVLIYSKEVADQRRHLRSGTHVFETIDLCTGAAEKLQTQEVVLEKLGLHVFSSTFWSWSQSSVVALLVLGLGEGGADVVYGLADAAGLSTVALRAGDLRRINDHPSQPIIEVDDRDEWDFEPTDYARKQNPLLPEDVTWQFHLPADLCLSAAEPPAVLLDRIPPALVSLSDIASLGEATGWSMDAIGPLIDMALIMAGHDTRELVPMLVERLLPRGEVVALVGPAKTGKSSLALQFAAAVSGTAKEVLGYRIPRPVGERGISVFLTTEDGPNAVMQRLKGFDRGGVRGPVVPVDRSPPNGPTLDLAAALDRIRGLRNVRLVVVDPWSVWLGSGKKDTDDGAVNEAFMLLQGFARHTGACVLVIHHTGKGSEKAHARDMGHLARGSQAFGDRARVMLGFSRKGVASCLAVATTNLAPQIVEHEVALIRDPAGTGLHLLAEGTAAKGERGAETADGVDDGATAVCVVARIFNEGGAVRPTGDRSLYKLTPPEMVGWSRRRIEGAVSAAIAGGALVKGEAGITPKLG